MIEDHLTDPLRWQRPRMVFVNSMSDLFYEDLPQQIDQIVAWSWSWRSGIPSSP
jgi:protein gp37